MMSSRVTMMSSRATKPPSIFGNRINYWKLEYSTSFSPAFDWITPARRVIHSTSKLTQTNRRSGWFTQSPFWKSSTVSFGDNYVLHRELQNEGDPYGLRKYLLKSNPSDGEDENDDGGKPQGKIIASLHANKNVLFGARVHALQQLSAPSHDTHISNFLAACGPLVDLAKEDASVNGQQPQALATLNGLCLWVKECLDRDGEGSAVLQHLMHGPYLNQNAEEQGVTDVPIKNLKEESIERSRKNKQRDFIIKDRSTWSRLENEKDRIISLEALRAIATGIPRPGHKVVGAGTYRDGKQAWISLALEYAEKAYSPNMNNHHSNCSIGPAEIILYRSRDGEVATIEHLAHTSPEYLRDAGGAMARMFFI